MTGSRSTDLKSSAMLICLSLCNSNEVGDGFVAKAWLANAGALAGVDIEEVVFVIPITLHIAAGLLQQIQSVTVEPWGKFIYHRKNVIKMRISKD